MYAPSQHIQSCFSSCLMNCLRRFVCLTAAYKKKESPEHTPPFMIQVFRRVSSQQNYNIARKYPALNGFMSAEIAWQFTQVTSKTSGKTPELRLQEIVYNLWWKERLCNDTTVLGSATSPGRPSPARSLNAAATTTAAAAGGAKPARAPACSTHLSLCREKHFIHTEDTCH